MISSLNLEGPSVSARQRAAAPDYRVMVCACSDHLPYSMEGFIEFFGKERASYYWLEAHRVRVIRSTGPREQWLWRFADSRSKSSILYDSGAVEHRIERRHLLKTHLCDNTVYVEVQSEDEFKNKYGEGPHWAHWQRSKVVTCAPIPMPRVPAGSNCARFGDASEDEDHESLQEGQLSSLAMRTPAQTAWRRLVLKLMEEGAAPREITTAVTRAPKFIHRPNHQPAGVDFALFADASDKEDQKSLQEGELTSLAMPRPRVPAGTNLAYFGDASDEEDHEFLQEGQLASLALAAAGRAAAEGAGARERTARKPRRKPNMRLFSSQAWIRKSACELKPVDTFADFHVFLAEEDSSGAAWLELARHGKVGSSSTSAGASWLESARQNKVGGSNIAGKEWLNSAARPRRCGYVQTCERRCIERRVLLTAESDLRIRSKSEFAEHFGEEAEKYWSCSTPEDFFNDWRILWGKPINLLAFYKLHRRVDNDWVEKWESAPKWRSCSPFCSDRSQASTMAAWRQ